jgi:ElaB/YqjD/DUF883 family membrane-anchored ribosome-binding protein
MFMGNKMNTEKEGIINDFNGVKNELGAKFTKAKETAEEAGQQAYDTEKSAINEVRTEGKQIADQVCAQASNTADTVRDYIKENPFRSLAIAVGAGVLFGYFRRSS